LLGDLGVLDRRSLVERLALHPLGDERARGDGRAAAVRLEARVLDASVGADLDLQLHDVAARRRAHHSGADRRVALLEGADVARVLVVVDDLVAVSHGCVLSLKNRFASARPQCAAHWTDSRSTPSWYISQRGDSSLSFATFAFRRSAA